MALVDVDEVLVDPAVGLGAVGVEGLAVGAATDVLHLADAAPLGLGTAVPEAGGEPGLPEVGRLDEVVVDADDLRERGGAAEPRGGVVDQISHGDSSVAANGMRGANWSSWARTSGQRPGPDAQDHLGHAQPGVVLELALAGDGAERDHAQGSRVTPRLFGQLAQARQGLAQPAAADGEPAVGVGGDGGEDGLPGAPADQRAHAGLLHRLGPRPGRPEVDELAVELGLLARPDRLHRRQVLAHDEPATAEVDAVILRLGPVPADAHAQRDPPTREMVEGRNRLARTMGSCWAASKIPVPSPIRLVTAAAVAKATRGSRQRL